MMSQTAAASNQTQTTLLHLGNAVPDCKNREPRKSILCNANSLSCFTQSICFVGSCSINHVITVTSRTADRQVAVRDEGSVTSKCA